jgi:hypothetical protein
MISQLLQSTAIGLARRFAYGKILNHHNSISSPAAAAAAAAAAIFPTSQLGSASRRCCCRCHCYRLTGLWSLL